MRGDEKATDGSQVWGLGRWVNGDAICSHKEHKKRNLEGEDDSALDMLRYPTGVVRRSFDIED